MGCQLTKAKPQNLALGEDIVDCEDTKYITKVNESISLPDTYLQVIPPKYEWVEGEIIGSSTEYYVVPPIYETITETIAVRPKCNEITLIETGRPRIIVRPAITKTITKRMIITPAQVKERIVPNVIEDGKTRVMVDPGYVQERVLSF